MIHFINKVVFGAVMFVSLNSVCFGQSWPTIEPISGEVVFSDPSKAMLKIDIIDIHQKPMYSLDCQSGDLEDENFNFSGLFQCRLVSKYSKENVSSLLVESIPQTADWEGRSRFLLNQVVGQCALMPDWGAERTFLLRRMRIMLGVRDVALTGNIPNPNVKAFKFTYKIMPDDSALSAITQKSQISEPWWFASGDNCLQEVLGAKL